MCVCVLSEIYKQNDLYKLERSVYKVGRTRLIFCCTVNICDLAPLAAASVTTSGVSRCTCLLCASQRLHAIRIDRSAFTQPMRVVCVHNLLPVSPVQWKPGRPPQIVSPKVQSHLRRRRAMSITVVISNHLQLAASCRRLLNCETIHM